MKKEELQALISLLDDPDEEIYKQISATILSIGQEVIPHLENAWENSFNSLLQQRIENIIHTIQFEHILKELKVWTKNKNNDLLEGALIIAKYQYPDLNTTTVKSKIEQIEQDVWLELNDNLTALEKIRVVNHIFFEIHGFTGNTTHYHAPQNSYINNVLESKKGNPLSLSILYIIISQNLGLPVFGVNLPEHFILSYLDGHSGKAAHDVLFYINPFSKGSVFSRKEIDVFLKQLKVNQDESYYEPCNNILIMKRLIQNLMLSYEKLGYPDKKTELNQLLNTLTA